MLGSIRAWGAAILTLAGVAAAPPAALHAQQAPPAPTPAANTVEAIRARGTLVCGVNTGLAGFGAPDAQGRYRGFDVDFCRAVAAAMLGDPERVRFVGTTTQNRFTALQSGEVDLLSRNTTWTFSRDTALGFDFPAVTFYDGQGFMVRADSGVSRGSEIGGATVCVQPGTTTEQNLADWARANRIQVQPVVIERLEEVTGAFFAGRCDVFTTDVSGLAATRAAQGARAEQYRILPDVISKEPLGPAVRQGDPRFADIVRWVHYAMVAAEEFGITSQNVEQAARTDPRPEVQRLLGRTGDLGQMLGLPNDWAVKVIRAVGNYGESFQRNLGPIGIQRGPNRLWTEGGLQYAPPFR
ncbi:amino acid ABC transporter substrate-binding protein [Caldovatus sp. SYSU G05006]|uniref:Amino acid ABC transporter substrate-binding protein n=2 Tax=Caldovatus aquaticus TaxID=2865671 RepID=A0ABS7F1Y6_9PROT|nr:amino acid ABC transporter substrate-binding protein [Caldovatus aquaticus]